MGQACPEVVGKSQELNIEQLTLLIVLNVNT